MLFHNLYIHEKVYFLKINLNFDGSNQIQQKSHEFMGKIKDVT